jgi:hypothetical protein
MAFLLCVQLRHFTCFNLERLRPTLPIGGATAAAAEGAAPSVPALTFRSIRVGGCYEFDLLAAEDGSGQRSAYVPAIVLRKQLVLEEEQKKRTKQSRCSRSIASCLDRLQEQQQQLAQAAGVPGTSAAGAAAPLGKLMQLTLYWPGALFTACACKCFCLEEHVYCCDILPVRLRQDSGGACCAGPLIYKALLPCASWRLLQAARN